MYIVTRYPKAGPKRIWVRGNHVFDVIDKILWVSRTRLRLIKIVNDVYYVRDNHNRVLTIHRDPRDAMRLIDV